MTDTTIQPKAANTEVGIIYDQIKELVAAAGDNPATLVFPTDRWGFTSGIKREVLKAASTVRGQDDKHALLVGTLAVLIAHIKKRKAKDEQVQADRMAGIQAARTERAPRERVTAIVTPKV